ncbi:MAG: hypothetical protein NTZ46_00230 [Verrucomicrobia bacterium]|nr:hypothetical protein [Verrucomicrobiota bacterium]
MTLDFTKLKNRFQSQALLAITVEPGRIALTLVHPGSPALPALSLDLSAAKLLENPVKAGAELLAALEAAHLRERRCVVCLPPSWALSASADLPEVSPENLRAYFELRAEREFSTSDLRLAHSPFFLPGGTRRATLAAIPEKRMEAVEKMLAAAGCHPVSISLALGGCLAKAEPMLHLLAQDGPTEVIVSNGGGIAAMRSFAASLVSDPAAFARELRITLGRLPEAVRQNVRRARIVGPAQPEVREVLMRMGIETIDEETEAPTSAAAECAGQVLRNQSVPFEFVVPEVNRWPALLERFNTRRGRQIAVAGVTIVLLPLLVFIFRTRTENNLNEEWNGMKNTVADLDDLQKRVRQYRPWFEPSPQKLQALETVITTFPERGEIWARSVQITTLSDKNETPGAGNLKVTVAGFTRSSANLLSLQDRLPKQPGVSSLQLQQIRGNNPIQFSLSFKWGSKHE